VYSTLVTNLQRLNEDAGATTGGMVGMATTQGSPSVDYLPGSFTSVRNMLRSLAPVKKQWGLEVLDEKENYRLKIEDALNIVVPKSAYAEFNAKVFNTSKNTFNITEMINEDVTAEVGSNIARLEKILYNIRRFPVVQQMIVLMETWLRLYPKTELVNTSENTALNLKSLKSDADNILKYVTELYSDDLGKLEGLVEAIYSGSPLNSFPPFSEKDYLVAVDLRSSYQGVNLRLVLRVDTSWHSMQYIEVEPELAIELEAIKTLKAVKDKVMPTSMQFAVKDFNLVKKVLDDVINS
jgi:hypothetical protein